MHLELFFLKLTSMQSDNSFKECLLQFFIQINKLFFIIFVIYVTGLTGVDISVNIRSQKLSS